MRVSGAMGGPYYRAKYGERLRGLVYRGTDDEGREVYCPVCLKYRAGYDSEVVKVSDRLCLTRKLIGRHLAAQRDKKSLEEEDREAKLEAR